MDISFIILENCVRLYNEVDRFNHSFRENGDGEHSVNTRVIVKLVYLLIVIDTQRSGTTRIGIFARDSYIWICCRKAVVSTKVF